MNWISVCLYYSFSTCVIGERLITLLHRMRRMRYKNIWSVRLKQSSGNPNANEAVLGAGKNIFVQTGQAFSN